MFTYPGRQPAVITTAGGLAGRRCRDEVWRYGCGEKPIQNPYGHEKTGHFTALQGTIRNERKTVVALAPQGERDNRLHQQTTDKDKSFGFGKDEAGGSNPPSSSRNALSRLVLRLRKWV